MNPNPEPGESLPQWIPAWDEYDDDGDANTLSEDQQLLALEMENYARYLEYTDHEVGRVVDAID